MSRAPDEKPETMQDDQLKRIVEAALLASPQPMTLAQLAGLFHEEEMPAHGALAKAISQLREECENRGIELVEVASGFRYQVAEDVHPWVSRLWAERPARYSRALLETMALIAYRQPMTRGEIEQVRGVAVSTNIIRTLEEREWIRVVGYRDVPGKPALYGTTKAFLDYFKLKSLDQLPPLSEVRDMENFDPQLSLDDGAIPPVALASPGDAETHPEDSSGAGSVDADDTPEHQGHGDDAGAHEETRA